MPIFDLSDQAKRIAQEIEIRLCRSINLYRDTRNIAKAIVTQLPCLKKDIPQLKKELKKFKESLEKTKSATRELWSFIRSVSNETDGLENLAKIIYHYPGIFHIFEARAFEPLWVQQMRHYYIVRPGRNPAEHHVLPQQGISSFRILMSFLYLGYAQHYQEAAAENERYAEQYRNLHEKCLRQAGSLGNFRAFLLLFEENIGKLEETLGKITDKPPEFLMGPEKKAIRARYRMAQVNFGRQSFGASKSVIDSDMQQAIAMRNTILKDISDIRMIEKNRTAGFLLLSYAHIYFAQKFCWVGLKSDAWPHYYHSIQCFYLAKHFSRVDDESNAINNATMGGNIDDLLPRIYGENLSTWEKIENNLVQWGLFFVKDREQARVLTQGIFQEVERGFVSKLT